METKLGKRSNHPRYGVILLPYSVSFERLVKTAQHAEDLGFDSVWISDHLQRDTTPTHECWTSIAALSALTSKISIGSLATCNSFRNPGLLAKMISTVSQISCGRTDFAIGLGYDKSEHQAYGYNFPEFKERVERLSETLLTLRSLWTKKKTNFEGKYWKFESTVCEPKPFGRMPRIWVAGRNHLVLKTAASGRAYGINILPYSGVMEKRRISSFEELELIAKQINRYKLNKSMYCGDSGLVIGKSKSDYEARLRRYASIQNLSISSARKKIENLSILHGATSECETELRRLATLGFEELMIIFPGWQMGDYSNMDLFAREFISN
ncbi:MAG: LLM class flavin-dependent oxidoreductase [Thaumarchaeota archaeon]|nr:LLM class flavin-dependent oxidoreductase [Nitrososphaerota archaeon]